MLLLAAMVVCVLALALSAEAAGVRPAPVVVENQGKAAVKDTPVSAGVPFARGTLRDLSTLVMAGPDGKPAAMQAATLAKWPDGSARWVLVDFLASAEGGAKSEYALSTGKAKTDVKNPASAKRDGKTVTLSNGIVTFRAAVGGSSGAMAAADDSKRTEVVSLVEIGPKDKRVTSKVVIDSIDIYAAGPVRAAASLYGRRVYSDGMEGPWSERVEVFAGCAYARVEDTFIYAHFPGSHAEPQNSLALWAVEARAKGAKDAFDIVSLVGPEEAEGLVVTDARVAFWGRPEPYNFARWTDEELVGEDTPGIALGWGSRLRCSWDSRRARRSARRHGGWGAVWAHTTGQVYAESGVLGKFAPKVEGKFVEAEEGVKQTLDFFMWFQDHDPKGLWGRGPWHGLFDWGDWQVRYTDIHNEPTGWQYTEGRYGWDCNEMDTTLMLWSAFCHDNRPEYWRAAVAMSRHMMDVDVLNVDYRKYKLPEYVYDPHSYGAPWKEGRDRIFTINTIGLGRRHNVQHWGNGVGDTRHTWNGGVIMYYYLTGNRRAYDTAIAMAEMHMQRIWGYACGEYTCGMWCLY